MVLIESFKVSMPKSSMKFLAANTKLSYKQVVRLIEDILQYTWFAVERDLLDWINAKVPHRTGQLRDDLKKWLQKNKVKRGILEIILKTKIKYASDVNAYTTSQVRHSGEIGYAYYYGHNGRIVLYDPEAIGGFWDHLTAYAEARAMFHLAVAKNKYLPKAGAIPAKVKNSLAVT